MFIMQDLRKYFRRVIARPAISSIFRLGVRAMQSTTEFEITR
jgi:hypothetical protein